MAHDVSGHPEAYGWRTRFGLMLPSSTFENIPYEFHSIVPPGVTGVITSFDYLPLPGDPDPLPMREQYRRRLERLEQAVNNLAQRNVDTILQVGLPPIIMMGPGFEEELRARVAKITPIPFVPSALSTITALKALNARRVAVLNPNEEYGEGQNEYIEAAGFEVVGTDWVHSSWGGNAESAPPGMAYQAAKRLFRKASNADVIWITASFMPSAAIIAPLENDIGIPVITNMQSLVWAGLQVARVSAPVTGYGRLFTTRFEP